MPAMYTAPVTLSPVIWTSRMKTALMTSYRGIQVAPLSLEQTTKRAPPPTSKLFQETYIRPKKEKPGCYRPSQTRGRR